MHTLRDAEIGASVAECRICSQLTPPRRLGVQKVKEGSVSYVSPREGLGWTVASFPRGEEVPIENIISHFGQAARYRS